MSVPSFPEAPAWSTSGAIAISVVSADAGHGLGDIRAALQSLWASIAIEEEVAGVVVVVRGSEAADPPRIPSDAPDADPRVGPRSCGVHQRVVLALSGTVDAWCFPLIEEADAVVAVRGVVLRDARDSVGSPEGELSLAATLPLPQQEITRLALLGTMTAERAHQLGVISAICRPTELIDVALMTAAE